MKLPPVAHMVTALILSVSATTMVVAQKSKSSPGVLADYEAERKAVAEQHYQLGLHSLERGRNSIAFGHFQYSVALNPRHVQALRQLGVLYYRGAKWGRETSDHYFSRALELDPRDLASYIYRAAIRITFGEYQAAEVDARAGLKIDPAREELQMLLASALLRQLRFSEAADVYRRVAEVNPGNIWAKWNLSLAVELAGGDGSSLPAELQIAYPAPDGSLSPVRFFDVARELGVDKLSHGRGAAWVDFDNDGLYDLFCAGIGDPHSLYRNKGGGVFTDVTSDTGLQDPRGGWAALAADFDNDGDEDLYVTRDGWMGRGLNSLYLNEGSVSFADAGVRLGVADGSDSFTAAAADYDKDGYLDIYVANGVSTPEGSPNVLYHNKGNGYFEEISLQAGVANSGNSIGSAWGDYNGDGYPDLYVANYGNPNALYRNRGDGTFEDVTIASGTIGPRYSFVSFFFDYNNDALLDLFMVSWTQDFPTAIRSAVEGRVVDEERRLALLRNDGDGTFTDVTFEAGLAINSGAMSAAYADLDNDGYLDLIIGNGGPTMDRYEPDRVFRNKGDGTFAEISRSVGLANIGKTHGIAGHDYDRDGDLDLYMGVGGQEFSDRQPNALFRNEGSDNHWLAIRLVGTRSNRNAVGTKVTVWTEDLLRFQEVAVGGGFGSTNSLPLEFGLGGHPRADRVEIVWPAGGKQTLLDVPADRFIEVVEGQDGYR